MDHLFFVHLMLGPPLFLIALALRVFPPKKINALYGYRTPRSMKSQEAWNEANRYSADAMIRISFLIMAFQVLSYYTMSPKVSVISTSVFTTVMLIALIPMTEMHLRKNFDEEGRKITNEA